ncbi:hypothetical protein D6858_03410 [Tsuneonella suprasediminis]|uniref:Uncharacterized protein n=1 Tax=Tsuneonella suprasediminis TaxID=2306996 RepID=A0A419R4B3_9SPHN|nr:hypothetical protein [Tsuneonella suprasediminis]RJX69591.1 hypothetical protein D6858_03410 [Tsuneonella suprasediminis]
MASVTFADLVEIYRATRFDGPDGGILTIANENMVSTLKAMEVDDVYNDAQIAIDGDAEPTVGAEVRISVGQPNASTMGLLVATFDDLFRSPRAFIAEPERYYVKDPGYAPGDQPVPDILLRYRAVLDVLPILKESASLFDDTQRQLAFLGKEKVLLPIQFTESDLRGDVVEKAERLTKLFTEELHIDEKRTILQTTLIEMVGSLRAETRFGFLIRNLERLADEVEKGYRLFISSFSYSKIRNDVETARLDFVGKIHKTIVDIQGQLLGIPVATIVVVSQLKKPVGCDVTFWTNLGVLVGAWVFVGMLAIAGLNQWKTLEVISNEIERQKARLNDDFASVANQFSDVFEDLDKRVRWHEGALIVIGIILGLGALATTIAFFMLTPSGSASCFAVWR